MKKKALIIIPILLVILLIAGVGVRIYVSNNQSDPSGNKDPGFTDDGEETEPKELEVNFFGEFVPFECNGDYTSFSYIGAVTNRDGTRFYAASTTENGKHKDALLYVLPNGEEKTVFSVGDIGADVEVMSFIDDALYFNISNAKSEDINGFYRMTFDYNEAGEIRNGDLTMRFNQNLEPMRVENNTILLRAGEQYYIFDTQTGEHYPYN